MNVIRLAIHIGLALHAISIGAAHADPGTNFMFEIQSGQISLQSIEALVSAAAQEEERLGFGLCMAAGRNFGECEKGDSVGFGVCMAAGRDFGECVKGRSVGFGLCMAAGREFAHCRQGE